MGTEIRIARERYAERFEGNVFLNENAEIVWRNALAIRTHDFGNRGKHPLEGNVGNRSEGSGF